MANIEAHTTAKTFIASWVSCFGVPAIITTDRERQFESDLFGELMKLLGSKQIPTTAYHPESNGLVERFPRCLKSALRAILNRSNWLKNLPLVLLELRTTVKEGIKCSSAVVVYDITLRLPGQFFCKSPQTPLDVTSFVDRLTAKMANIVYNPPAQCKKPTYVSKLFETSTHAFVKDLARKHSLQLPYRVPFKILKRHKKYFTMSIKNGALNISLDRLKPAFLDTAWLNVSPQISFLSPVVTNKPKQTVTRFGRHLQYPRYLYC